MTTPEQARATGAEYIPIWQDGAHAKWLISVESDRDQTGEDYWSGWLDIDADADAGHVALVDAELTPDEARNAARALMAAADHVEQFHQRRCEELFRLTLGGHWPELDQLPTETQVAVRDALRATERYWRNRQAAAKARRAGGDS